MHRIRFGLAEAKDLFGKHAIKQVDQLLSNEKLVVWHCAAYYIPYIIGARKEIVVAMHSTDFDGDKQSTIAISLVTSHGRATPLIWKTVSKKKLKKNETIMKTKFCQEYEVPIVVCVKAKNMKQTWCITASNEKAVARELINWYDKRGGIEPALK